MSGSALSVVYDVYALRKESDGTLTPVAYDSFSDPTKADEAAKSLGNALVLKTESRVVQEYRDEKPCRDGTNMPGG